MDLVGNEDSFINFDLYPVYKTELTGIKAIGKNRHKGQRRIYIFLKTGQHIKQVKSNIYSICCCHIEILQKKCVLLLLDPNLDFLILSYYLPLLRLSVFTSC